MGKIQESINKAVSATVVPATMIGAGKVAIEAQARKAFEKEQGLPDIVSETNLYKEALGEAKKEAILSSGEDKKIAEEKVKEVEPLVKKGEELQSSIDMDWEMKKRALTTSMAKQRNVSYFRAGFKKFIDRLTGGND